MFFTYLRRELRRRMRQAVFIALGLALGVGLVITVTAASSGVKNAQGTVLHALYGVGTSLTVTKTPKAGSFNPGSFGFGFRAGTGDRPAAGTKINTNTLSSSPTLASISSSSVSTVAKLDNVAAAAGGLTLDNRTLSGTVPAINFNGGAGGGAPASGGAGSGGRRRPELPGQLQHQQLRRGGRGHRDRRARPAQLGQAQLGPDLHRVGRLVGRRHGGRLVRHAAQAEGRIHHRHRQQQGHLDELQGDRDRQRARREQPLGRLHPAGRGAEPGRHEERGQHHLRRGQQRRGHRLSAIRDQEGLAVRDRDHLGRPGQRGHRLAVQRLQPGQQPGQVARAGRPGRRVRPGQPADDGGGLAAGARVRHAEGARLEEPPHHRPGDGRGDHAGHPRRGDRHRARLGRRRAGLQAVAQAVRRGRPDHRLGDPGRRPPVRLPRRGRGYRAGPGGGSFNRAANSASHTVAVHLSASVSAGMIVLAVVLAIAGGIIAGIFGGWRAARLRPAAALAKVA